MKAKTASPFQIVVMSTNSDCFVFDFVYFFVFFLLFFVFLSGTVPGSGVQQTEVD